MKTCIINSLTGTRLAGTLVVATLVVSVNAGFTDPLPGSTAVVAHTSFVLNDLEPQQPIGGPSARVWPETFSDVLYFRVSNYRLSSVRIVLYDVEQEAVLDETVLYTTSTMHVNTTTIEPGTYVVHIISSKGELITKLAVTKKEEGH